MDFLHPDNVAGQTLLTLVARGSAIITELLRLSDHIPSVFQGSPNDPIEREKYAPILLDFRYLKNADLYDEKIDADADTVDLDEEFRENNMQMLERFYMLFDSVYRYYSDFQSYLEEMSEGVFVQHTIEGVLLDSEGRQLMLEALFLYGVMLLLLEQRIPGPTRERMIVFFYRHKGASTISNIDEVCKLCRSTGFVPGGKRPPNYPEEYFSRYTLKPFYVDMMLGRLRTDDVYNHTSSFPAPEHRSAALASQSAMLYVILYFHKDTLHNKTSIMREIVDKFFADNWVISFFMGFTVDLTEAWEPYKAASKALNNIMTKGNVTEVVQRHQENVPKLLGQLNKYLTEGVLADDFCLDNVRKLSNITRHCNVTLRWYLLHRTTLQKKYREQIHASTNVAALMELLINSAQFEWKLKEVFGKLLAEKEARWEECKKEAAERMTDLAQYFSGELALTRVKKNENLQGWFTQLASTIQTLDFNEPIVAGRQISQLNQALEDVEEFHQIETSLQVKSFLADTRSFLSQMVRTVNVNEKVLADLDIVSDFAYGWVVIKEYTSLLHRRIAENPAMCLRLRAVFLKAASILSLPLVRITQCGSRDDISVAEYYSSALVAYVRQVLEVIPKSVFQILDGIIHLQTHTLKDIPTKMERKYIKDFAQLDVRYDLAKNTHQVSVFTEGILAMKTTLVGIIKLDPRKLLEDGVRKELVRQIAGALDNFLVFKTGHLGDFEQRLQRLGTKLDGFKKSFEYIQDYINMYGLKIWQQEFSRIINYNVEQESNSFLKKKIYAWQSTYQSDAIPVPTFNPITPAKGQEQSVNFMGRLVREILSQTHPSKTVYIESMQGWFDLNNNNEVVGIRTWSLLHRGVGVFGLTGMDHLLCFMIVRDLNAYVRLYRRTVSDKQVSNFISVLGRELKPTSQFPQKNTQKRYAVAQKKTQNLWANFLISVIKIGQAQLIRRQISNELNFCCQLDSKILYCALDTMNKALLRDVEAHYNTPDQKPYPGGKILPDISTYLETAGINNPITKIYITTEPLEGLPCLMFLFVLAQVMKLEWNAQANTLVAVQKGGVIDGAPFVVGVITILKQFHSSHTHTFLGYLGQYVRSNISCTETSSKDTKIPPAVSKVLLFLEEFCKFGAVTRKVIDSIVPPYIFDRFAHN